MGKRQRGDGGEVKPTGRRERGSGNFKKTKAGTVRWRTQIAGKWHSGTEDTLEAAKDAFDRVRFAHKQGKLADKDAVTVELFAKRWLAYKTAERRSPATLDSYERQLENNILPYLGKLKLQKLSGKHLQDMYEALYQRPVQQTPRKEGATGHARKKRALLVAEGKGELVQRSVATSRGRGKRTITVLERTDGGTTKASTHLSNASLRTTHTVLHGLLKHAVEAGIITINPADIVRPRPSPEGRAKKKTGYRPEEVGAILPILRSDPQNLIYELVIVLGTRRAEACGVQWSNIDWAAGTAHLVLGVKKVKGGRILGPLKTDNSNRVMKVPPVLLERLRERQVLQEADRDRVIAAGGTWPDHGLVFTTRNGDMIDPDGLRTRFDAICTKAKVRKLSIQSLRRTYANLKRRREVPLEIVAANLGHTDTRTLSQYYRVVDEDERHRDSEDLDDMIR